MLPFVKKVKDLLLEMPQSVYANICGPFITANFFVFILLKKNVEWQLHRKLLKTNWVQKTFQYSRDLDWSFRAEWTDNENDDNKMNIKLHACY